MKNIFLTIFLFFFFGLIAGVQAQDDLMDLLESETEEVTDYTIATFKAVKLINGHTIEMPAHGVLEMYISHRFGQVNGGDDSPFYQLFGLDQATLRIGLEYGIKDWLTVGVGRSNVGKTFDGFIKGKILRQSSGKKSFPFTLTAVGATALKTLKESGKDFEFDQRLSYTGQLLIARKFNERFSLQLMPTWVHRNVVPLATDENDVFALGTGARLKLTKGMALNVEYFYVFSPETSTNGTNSLSVGLDIETGGHVFQLFFTNSRGMTENYFVPGDDPFIVNGDWSKGEVHFGFNISRVFTVVRK